MDFLGEGGDGSKPEQDETAYELQRNFGATARPRLVRKTVWRQLVYARSRIFKDLPAPGAHVIRFWKDYLKRMSARAIPSRAGKLTLQSF